MSRVDWGTELQPFVLFRKKGCRIDTGTIKRFQRLYIQSDQNEGLSTNGKRSSLSFKLDRQWKHGRTYAPLKSCAPRPAQLSVEDRTRAARLYLVVRWDDEATKIFWVVYRMSRALYSDFQQQITRVLFKFNCQMQLENIEIWSEHHVDYGTAIDTKTSTPSTVV